MLEDEGVRSEDLEGDGLEVILEVCQIRDADAESVKATYHIP